MTIKDILFKQSNKIQVGSVSATRVDNVSSYSVNTEQDKDLSDSAIHVSRNKPLDFSDKGGSVEYAAKLAPLNKSNNPSLSKDDLQAKTIAKLSDIINNLDDVNEAGHITNIELNDVSQQIKDKLAAKLSNSIDGINELGFDGPAREEDVTFELLDGSDASKPVLDYWTLGQAIPVAEGDLRHNLRISMKVTPKSTNETEDGKALKSYMVADPVEIKNDVGFSGMLCHDITKVTNGYDIGDVKVVFANGHIAKFEETEETNDQGKTKYLMEIDVHVINPEMKSEGSGIIAHSEYELGQGMKPYREMLCGGVSSHLPLAHLHSYSIDELKPGPNVGGFLPVNPGNLILNPDFATSKYWFEQGALKHISLGRFISNDDFTPASDYYGPTPDAPDRGPSTLLELKIGALEMDGGYRRSIVTAQVDESTVESFIKKTDAEGDYINGEPIISKFDDMTAGEIDIDHYSIPNYHYANRNYSWDVSRPETYAYVDPKEFYYNEDGSQNDAAEAGSRWYVRFYDENDNELGFYHLNSYYARIKTLFPKTGSYPTGIMSTLRDQYFMNYEQADYYTVGGTPTAAAKDYIQIKIPAGTSRLRWGQRSPAEEDVEPMLPSSLYTEESVTRIPWVDLSTAMSTAGVSLQFENACKVGVIGDRYFIDSPKMGLTNVYRKPFVPPLDIWCPTAAIHHPETFENIMGNLRYPFNKDITLDVSDLNVVPGDSVFDSRRYTKYTVNEDLTITFKTDNTVNNCSVNATFEKCVVLHENEEASFTSLYWKSNNSTMGAKHQIGNTINPTNTHEFSVSLKQVISNTESLRRLENSWGCNYDFEINQVVEARDGKFYKINVTMDNENPDNMLMRKTQCKLTVDKSDNVTGPFTRMISDKDADIVSALDEGGELFEREDRCLTMLVRCQYESNDQDSFSQVCSSIKLNDNCEGSFKISKCDDQSYIMDDRIPNGRSMSKKEMNDYLSCRVGWFIIGESRQITPAEQSGTGIATQIGKGLYAVQNYTSAYSRLQKGYATPEWTQDQWNLVFNINGKEFNVPWEFVSNVPENGISIIRIADSDLPEELNVPPPRFSTLQDHQSSQEGETLCYHTSKNFQRNMVKYCEKSAEEEYSHPSFAGRTVSISRNNSATIQGEGGYEGYLRNHSERNSLSTGGLFSRSGLDSGKIVAFDLYGGIDVDTRIPTFNLKSRVATSLFAGRSEYAPGTNDTMMTSDGAIEMGSHTSQERPCMGAWFIKNNMSWLADGKQQYPNEYCKIICSETKTDDDMDNAWDTGLGSSLNYLKSKDIRDVELNTVPASQSYNDWGAIAGNYDDPHEAATGVCFLRNGETFSTQNNPNQNFLDFSRRNIYQSAFGDAFAAGFTKCVFKIVPVRQTEVRATDVDTMNTSIAGYEGYNKNAAGETITHNKDGTAAAYYVTCSLLWENSNVITYDNDASLGYFDDMITQSLPLGDNSETINRKLKDLHKDSLKSEDGRHVYENYFNQLERTVVSKMLKDIERSIQNTN